MLFHLAMRNIKSNLRNYTAYFLSVACSVFVFYLFSALRYNSTLESLMSGDVKAAAMFQVSGWLIAAFAVIFLWYATSFFLMKRKQEIGLYALLGVRRSRIGGALFAEMMAAGLLSLAAGLAAGMLLSRLLFPVIGGLLELGEPLYRGISLRALGITAGTFFLILLITAFSAFRIVYRYTLSELFSAGSKEEAPLRFHKWIAVLGALILLAGYAGICSVDSGESFATVLPFGVIAVAVGTFLVFRETVPAILQRIRHSSRFFSDIRVMMNVSGTLYRIRKNYRTWAVLSLLIAAAVSLVAGGYETAHTIYQTDRAFHPFTFTYVRQNQQTEQKIDALMQAQTDHQVVHRITTEETLYPGAFVDANGTARAADAVVLLPESALRALEQACGIKTGCPVLQDGQAAVLGYEGRKGETPAPASVVLRGDVPRTLPVLAVLDRNPAVLDRDRVAVVVSDALYQTLRQGGTVRQIVSYLNQNEMSTSALTLRLQDLLPESAQLNYAYENAMVLAYARVLLLILVFIGLLFLAATGSVLRFKAYWEGEDDRENDRILHQLGAKKRDLAGIAAAQARTMFLAPLAMASLHILAFCAALTHWKLISSWVPIAVSIGACVGIYLLYYLATVFSLRKKVLQYGGVL